MSYETDELHQGSPVLGLPSLSNEGKNVGETLQHEEQVEEAAQAFSPAAMSSPLSSPPSSSKFRSPLCSQRNEVSSLQADVLNGERNQEQVQQCVQVLIPQEGMGSTGNHTDDEMMQQSLTQAAAARNLRRRKAIQLHPFLIEGEKYRTFMQARGLKPLHVNVAQQQGHARAQHTETQDGEFQEETQISDPQFPQSPPESEHSADEMFPLQSPKQASFEDDEELPDLSTVLEKPKSSFSLNKMRQYRSKHSLSHGKVKKRDPGKLPNVRFRKPRFTIPGSSSPLEPEVHNLKTATESSQMSIDGDIHSFLPQATHEAMDQQLPTPLTSSDGKTLREPDAIISDDEPIALGNYKDTRPEHSQLAPSREISDKESAESNTDESIVDDIKRVQKKIKGVLPASWLRLNRPDQAQKPDRRKPQESSRSIIISDAGSMSPLNDDDRSTKNSSRAIMIFSDESDASRSPAQSPRPTNNTNLGGYSGRRSSPATLIGAEAEEEDFVDPILSVERSRSYHTKRQRQLKLSDALPVTKIKPQPTSKIKPLSTKNTFRKQNTKKKNQARTPRRHVRLSILDMNQEPSMEDITVPNFIQVARRRALCLPDKGRQSPTAKRIKLHRRVDTEDAEATLMAWRSGSIRPMQHQQVTSAGLSTRVPLKTISGNTHQPKITTLKSRQEDGRIRKGLTRPDDASNLPEQLNRKRQTQLDVLITDKDDQVPQADHVDVRQPPTMKTKPIRRKQRVTLRSNFVRSAQLEGVDSAFSGYARQLNFSSELMKRNVEFTNALKGLPLNDNEEQGHSYWQGAISVDDRSEISNSDRILINVDAAQPLQRKRLRRLRKASPRRLDVQAKDYRQPDEPSPILESPLLSQEEVRQPPVSENVLTGLGSFGTVYTKAFDVSKLEPGTYFHESTFVGSERLKEALDVQHRDLDQAAPFFTQCSNSRLYRWGAWGEEVSADFDAIFRRVRSHCAADLYHGHPSHATVRDDSIISDLWCVIKYISTTLHFLDPVDRSSFVERIRWILQETVEAAGDWFSRVEKSTDSKTRSQCSSQYLQPLSLLLVLAGQMLMLANHVTIKPVVKDKVTEVFKLLVALSTKVFFIDGIVEVSRFLEDNKFHVKRDAGIRSSEVHVEWLTVLSNTLRIVRIPQLSFWDAVNLNLLQPSHANNVTELESAWKAMFVMLPVTCLNSSGMLRVESDGDNWLLVKALLAKVLNLYEETARGQISTLNGYLRICLTRCHYLLREWEWLKCEPLLGLIFDFFAQNRLQNLKHESPKGSPAFLHEFSQEVELQIEPEDRAFHIFLKLLASGLLMLRQRVPEKKLLSTVWRFIPNHGRIYKKDEMVSREEIDALRNHHDILCTLYLAASRRCRPRISLIRNLVNHDKSHEAACQLSINSWTMLTKFQVKAEEPIENLEPLLHWYKEIVNQTVSQYHSARAEVENFIAEHERSVSTTFLEKTIVSNQNQVLRSLSEKISAMGIVIGHTSSGTIAAKVIKEAHFSDMLKLYDVKSARFDFVVCEALGVVLQLINVCRKETIALTSKSNDDSQGYGDWLDLVDIEPINSEISPKTSGNSAVFVQDALANLLSDVLGSERQPDDGLVQKLVRCWVETASCLVCNGVKEWTSYLDAHTPDSWFQFRNSEHARKIYPLVMATVLEYIGQSYAENVLFFINALILSLVERESLFKYQHQLLTAMLNRDGHHPLLHNSPFCLDTRCGSYIISLATLKTRRLQLLSNILSNMRVDLSDNTSTDIAALQRKRFEYRSLLKQVMDRMKTRYLELQEISTTPGAYVDFVHSMVDLLQQHVADIVPVDNFFTSASTFPLPSKDPTYIVARLKSYAHKLKELRNLKQLSMFIQAASERAAIEDNQEQFEDQLYEALSYEMEGEDCLGLRRTLLLAIFPAYIEMSLAVSKGRTLALPMLNAARRMFDDLLYKCIATHEDFWLSVGRMLASFLSIVCSLCEKLVHTRHFLFSPYIATILEVLFNCLTSSVTVLDYVYQLGYLRQTTLSQLIFIQQAGVFALETLPGVASLQPPPSESLDYSDTDGDEFSEIRQYCKRELGQYLDKHWSVSQGQHWFRRGSVSKQIRLPRVMYGDRRMELANAVVKFNERLWQSGLLSDGVERHGYIKKREVVLGGAADVMI